jgi:hypothetical protein
LDKGKGRERDSLSAVATPADADSLDAGDADDDDAPGAKGEKKKKNTYRHLIKGIPGVFSILSFSSFFLSSIPALHFLVEHRGVCALTLTHAYFVFFQANTH